MSIEIVVAIITAAASLIVAVISIIMSIVSSKHVEHLRYNLGEKRNKRKRREHKLMKESAAIDSIIQEIQRLKDVLYLIINSKYESMDSETAINKIKKSVQNLIDCYDDNMTNLNENDKSIAHETKNSSVVIENLIVEYVKDKEYISYITDKEREELTKIRNELTDVQNLLRDSKTKNLEKKLEKL